MDRTMLGRYEYTDNTSNKFWHIYFDPASKSYITEWGKIGSPPQGRKGGLSEGEAYRKIQEKRGKGYRLVGGFKEMRGSTPQDVGDEEAVVRVSVGKSSSSNQNRRKVTF